MKNLFKFRKKQAFTLVEMLLVSTIIAVLALSLYRSLSVGIKVFEASRSFSVEEDIMIFLDKLSMDLRNAIDFSLFDFEGGSSKIAFTTIVSVPMGNVDSGGIKFFADQIGRVQYGVDVSERKIYRQVSNYSQATKKKSGAPKWLVSSVDRIYFKYYSLGKTKLSEQKIDKDVLPSAVEVMIYYRDHKDEARILTRLINLPLHS